MGAGAGLQMAGAESHCVGEEGAVRAAGREREEEECGWAAEGQGRMKRTGRGAWKGSAGVI